jgi:F-type H+-transporting ATPase subunit b
VIATKLAVLAQESVNDKRDLYPHAAELIVGAVAFGILFWFMWKWVLPRVNTLLEERRKQIQGQLEIAEQTRKEAEQELADYRAQLANARDKANEIIEEARTTADQLRRDIQAKAEEESRNTVVRAQEEIRAERDRVLQDLRGEVGDIAVELAERVVGASLDKTAHERLIEEYIDQVTKSGSANGKGHD